MRTIVALFAALLVVSTASNAQELWNGTSVGMSVAQVRQTIPGLVDHEQNEKNKLPTGAYKLLVSKGPIELANSKFKLEFYFLNGRLTQATLVTEKSKTQVEASEKELKALLRNRYGPEVDSKSDAYTSETTWQKDKSRIRLFRVVSNMYLIFAEAPTSGK
jgi:hypothetical protein